MKTGTRTVGASIIYHQSNGDIFFEKHCPKCNIPIESPEKSDVYVRWRTDGKVVNNPIGKCKKCGDVKLTYIGSI